MPKLAVEEKLSPELAVPPAGIAVVERIVGPPTPFLRSNVGCPATRKLKVRGVPVPALLLSIMKVFALKNACRYSKLLVTDASDPLTMSHPPKFAPAICNPTEARAGLKKLYLLTPPTCRSASLLVAPLAVSVRLSLIPVGLPLVFHVPDRSSRLCALALVRL